MYDVAVIGGGMAGLTTAARLQRCGLRTVVLEAHGQPGGCAGFFRRRGFAFDVGATTLVDFEANGVGGELLTDLGMPPMTGEALPGYLAWLPDRIVGFRRRGGDRRDGASRPTRPMRRWGLGECDTRRMFLADVWTVDELDGDSLSVIIFTSYINDARINASQQSALGGASLDGDSHLPGESRDQERRSLPCLGASFVPAVSTAKRFSTGWRTRVVAAAAACVFATAAPSGMTRR